MSRSVILFGALLVVAVTHVLPPLGACRTAGRGRYSAVVDWATYLVSHPRAELVARTPLVRCPGSPLLRIDGLDVGVSATALEGPNPMAGRGRRT